MIVLAVLERPPDDEAETADMADAADRIELCVPVLGRGVISLGRAVTSPEIAAPAATPIVDIPDPEAPYMFRPLIEPLRLPGRRGPMAFMVSVTLGIGGDENSC